MSIETDLQKCKNCGKETTYGKYYYFYYGPDLGDHEYKINTGNAITTNTVKGRKVDGLAKIYLCHRCVGTRYKEGQAGTRLGWIAFIVLMVMGWPATGFLLYTVFTYENTDLTRGIFVITAIVLAILSVIWYFFLRAGDKARAKALEAMSDDEMQRMIENPDKKDTDLVDGFAGDLLSKLIAYKEVENKKSSPGKYGYYYLTRREYKALSGAVDYDL